MTIFEAVVLGLVEGITEYLPVSSTGHLILAKGLLGLDDPAQASACDAFLVVVQGGAILAVLGLYRARVLQMLRGLLGRDAAGLRLAINLAIAFVPAAGIGFALDDAIEANLFSASPVIAAIALGGLYMMWIDRWHKDRTHGAVGLGAGRPLDELTPAQAFVIGLLQCVAMWPGTSRSMMTITGGYLVGLRPKDAAEFSFLLGLPTLGAATAYTLGKNLIESDRAGTPNMIEALGVVPVLVGIAVATISAALAVRWLVGFLNRAGLTPFGLYRLALAGVLIVLMGAGVVRLA